MTSQFMPVGRGSDHDQLTRREQEVVLLIAEGLSCREAAKRLSRSPRTIENHLRSVYQKWHVRNRVELVRVAEERGLRSGEGKAPRATGEIELKGHALELILRIDSRLSRCDHEQYFGGLSLALAEAFGTRWAGISEISHHGGLLDIISFAADGTLADVIECPVDGSPCGVAIRDGECAVWEGLSDRFPADRSLVECGAWAYVGVALRDRVLGPVGSLWIMDDKPIDRSLLPLQVLRLLAPRTAAELAVAKMLDGAGGANPADALAG